jgi:hypothetical protein
MTVIRLNVPPDHTPEEEAALVAMVASAYADSAATSDEVTIEVNRPDEVDYRTTRAGQASRWVS